MRNWKPASGWKKQIQSPYGSVPRFIFAQAPRRVYNTTERPPEGGLSPSSADRPPSVVGRLRINSVNTDNTDDRGSSPRTDSADNSRHSKRDDIHSHKRDIHTRKQARSHTDSRTRHRHK